MSTPSLAEAINSAAQSPSPPGPRCSIGILLEDLAEKDPEGHQAVVGAIDACKLSATVIAQTLAAFGYETTGYRIGHHRRRLRSAGCRCSR